MSTGPPPSIQPTGVFEGLRPLPIFLGVVVDTVATVVTSVLVVFAFLPREAGQEGGEVSQETIEALTSRPEYLAASLIAGLLCTVFGAFVGARRAGSSFVRHGAWIAIGSAVLGLIQYASAPADAPSRPFWFELVGFGLMLPAGLAGGILAANVRRAGRGMTAE